MNIVAKSHDFILYETKDGKGYCVNSETGTKTEEKAIISLLSMADEWEPYIAERKDMRIIKDIGTMEYEGRAYTTLGKTEPTALNVDIGEILQVTVDDIDDNLFWDNAEVVGLVRNSDEVDSSRKCLALMEEYAELRKSHQANPPYPGAAFDEQKHRWVVEEKEKEKQFEEWRRTIKYKKLLDPSRPHPDVDRAKNYKDVDAFLKDSFDTSKMKLEEIWNDYKIGNKKESGLLLFKYLEQHPEEAKEIAERSREIVKHYSYLYRVGDNTGMSWSPNRTKLRAEFPDEEEIYRKPVTEKLLKRVIGHEEAFPPNKMTRFNPEQEVLLLPESEDVADLQEEYEEYLKEAWKVAHSNEIRKARVYLKPGEQAPQGVNVREGKKHGRFYDSPGRQAATSKEEQTQSAASKPVEPKKEKGKLAIPPNWQNVWINPDKNSPLLVTALDEKGRHVYIYSKEFSEQKAAEKFARLKAFTQATPKIMQSIRNEKNSKEEAAILFIISQTGFRIGSDKNTKAKTKAYGISTLEGRHVKVNGDNVEFDFIGKEGIRNHKVVNSKELAETINQYKKGDNDRLFKSSGSSARDYLKKIAGQPFKVKDFRTYIATTTAVDAVKNMPIPKTMKELKSYKQTVAKKVSEVLCNTPDMALKAYIAPEVFAPWIGQLQKEGIMKEYSSINDLFGEVFYDEYGQWEGVEDDEEDEDEDEEEEKGKKVWRKDDEVEQPSADVVWDGTKTPKLSLLQDYLDKGGHVGLIPVKRQAKNKFGTVYTIIRYIDPETGKQHFPGKWKGGVQGKETPNYDLEAEGRANAAEEAGTGARAEYGPTEKPWTDKFGVKVKDTQMGTEYSNKDLTITIVNTGANFIIREAGKIKGSVPRERDAVKYAQKRFEEESKKIKKGEDGVLQMGSEGQKGCEKGETKERVILGFPGAKGEGEEVEEEKEGDREMLCVKEGDTGKLSIDEHLFLLGVKKQEDTETIKTYGEWMHLKKSADDSFVHSDIRIKINGSDSIFSFSSALINSRDRNKLVEPAKKDKIFISNFQQPMHNYDWINRIGRDEAWVLKSQDGCSMVYKIETEADVLFGKVEKDFIEMEITNTQKIPEGRWKLQCANLNKENKWMLSYWER